MTKECQLNQRIITLSLVFIYVHELSAKRYSSPSYDEVANWLNSLHKLTSRGNTWTRKRLFRFLQNAGYCGLHGIKNNRTNQSAPLTPENQKGIYGHLKERESQCSVKGI
jgi:hypothetical protein